MDASSGSDYFIVVPMLDEAEALPGLLAELRDLGLLERTVFVDNGSRDGGPDFVRAAGAELLHEPRRGYGYPCLTGARAAAARGARAVVFMEADGTDDPAQVPALVGPVLAGVADLVVGSRRQAVRGAAAGHMPWHQRRGNDWLAVSLRFWFGLRLSDDGPFRAVRLDLLRAAAPRGARLRLPHRDGGEGPSARRPDRPARHPLPPARRPFQDRRHLARHARRRLGHLLVPLPPAAVRLPPGALTALPRAARRDPPAQ